MSFAIYMIRNTTNDRVYVGETVAPVEMRLMAHRRRLEMGLHDKPELQADWDRLGADAFEFTILRIYHENAFLGRRRQIEREWMDRLQSAHPVYGYNTRNYGRRHP